MQGTAVYGTSIFESADAAVLTSLLPEVLTIMSVIMMLPWIQMKYVGKASSPISLRV